MLSRNQLCWHEDAKRRNELFALVPTLRVGTHSPDASRPWIGTCYRATSYVGTRTRSVQDVSYDAKRRNELLDENR